MNVLVACEFSGVVRDAFIRKGHNAVSCDLLPSEAPGPHIQADVSGLLCMGWDLMIAHPPCTYLCSSGLHWNSKRPERKRETDKALRFVHMLLDAPVKKIAVENPIGCISTRIRKPDQIVQPWMFGHGETKATCLWLKNLPALQATSIVSGREQKCWKCPPSENRWKVRSITYSGIASAMAEQWG